MLKITDDQIEQYRQRGFFFLESVIPKNIIEDLRVECQRYIDKFDAEMEAKCVTTLGINHYKKRYFVANRSQDSAIMRNFLFSELMADVARATLGEDAYLFHEQYVVKAADVGTKFAWHQDSGYVGHYHRPYLSCWCALDDMYVENGTIFVLPYERAGMTPDHLFDHVIEEGSNDKIGYHGDDPGDPFIAPAGSIAVFSSRTFHRSGPNSTPNMRRCYLAQYSAEPIMNREGTKLWGKAIPLLKDGTRLEPNYSA